MNSRVFHTVLFSSLYVDGAITLQRPKARSVNVNPTSSMPMSVLGRWRVGAVMGTVTCDDESGSISDIIEQEILEFL